MSGHSFRSGCTLPKSGFRRPRRADGGDAHPRRPQQDDHTGGSTLGLAEGATEAGRETVLQHQGFAEAVLVRPDRYVFGTGDAKSLASEWAALLG